MNMPIIEIKYNPTTQIEKIEEEVEEFLTARNRVNRMEEALDVIQAMWTFILNDYSARELMKGFDAHYRKLISRDHKILGDITIKLE